MNFGIRSLEEDVHEEASKLKSLQVPLVEISAWKIRSTNYYKIPEISVGAPLWFVQLESSRNEHGGSSEKVVLFFFSGWSVSNGSPRSVYTRVLAHTSSRPSRILVITARRQTFSVKKWNKSFPCGT